MIPNRLFKRLITLYSLSLFSLSLSLAAYANSDLKVQNQAIMKIVEQFDQAIINKDKANFMTLFYDGPVSWVGVFSEQTMAHRQAYLDTMPQEKRFPNRKNFSSTPEEFIDSIVKHKSKSRESFDNFKITTDGSIATVHFDYVFYRDDYRGNWGEEGWHLVKTSDGWRINSVIFSMTINPQTFEKIKDQK